MARPASQALAASPVLARQPNQEGVVDADFEEVDGNNKKSA